MITAIRQDDDNPAVRALEELMARLYPDEHPYGRRTKGSIDVVERLTRERLVRLHAERFAPSELTAVIVGDVDPARAQAVAARVFGGWKKHSPAPIVLAPPASAATARRRIVMPMMNKSQADVAYGFITIARTRPGLLRVLADECRVRSVRASADVSATASASGRAWPTTRRARSTPTCRRVRSRFGQESARRTSIAAIASIDEEIVRLVRDGLTEQELDESRRYLIGSIPRSLETNAAIANFLQTSEFFGLGLDYDVRLPDLLTASRSTMSTRAARAALDPARATLVIAGPYADQQLGDWRIGQLGNL